MSAEGSAEVSVPTDLTVTSDGDSEEGYAASRRYARELQNLASEKAELQRIVQKQKLELQSKDAQLAALTREHEAAAAKAVSQKDDQISSKQIQVNRLDAELSRAKAELNMFRERAARELAQLTQKCALFQQNQKRLTIKQDELRTSLANLTLTEEEFIRLRRTPAQQLTLQQYTALRVYELVWPLRVKFNEAEAVKLSLESALSAKDSDLKSRSEQCLKLQRNIEELHRKSDQYASQLMNLKDEQRSDDYKVRNYARVKTERDQLQEEKTSLTKRTNELELLVATLKKERNILEERSSDLKGKTRKQEQDLNQYQEDVVDLRTKLDRITEELKTCNKNLHLERERNEDLHGKYVAARGDITSLTENSQDYQHEIKMLREKCQSYNLQCSNLQEKVSLLSEKNEMLCIELEKCNLKYIAETQALDTEVKELRSSVSSLSKNRDGLVDENSKLYQEIQKLEASYLEEKSKRSNENMALNQELQRVKHLLAGYEGLEIEYEKNIRTAATLPEDEANKVLDKILPGLRLTGNKGLEHSISLTRRVLQLERQNTEACTTIQQLSDALEHLRNTVASYKTALTLAGQPSSNLLERIASQDDQITILQAALQHNSLSKTTLEEENKTLTREVIKLKNELDSMVNETNELSAIKQQLQVVLQALPQASFSQPNTGLQDDHHKSGSASGLPAGNQTSRTDEQGKHQSSTKAIIITKDSRRGRH
ncbi:progesterone-induced-blocking factor 1-like [Homarus americanus]|uniref:Progesterone-induced-blocking factor 1-like n=1 Tax=Homarus americanus TaxID=6706 RepID=A0A8J5THU7_HOMAM|nr:progesterone-induced-blocking factor 1-like [Homarus americanus]XP_042210246.1 progesterone-induced-blocking factor 1-like [Homarus americanus]XP_042210247.1 progesterone-induced-blocking factor 1-like [Homarus americanus]XP_042210249.1 progesterone-induced-blocking factor 1-like [Homarus americanus]KAG7175514.1 Progesterone-induced-blocking factor 1-like [Homarus americanus]